ncbi:hypothetical protein ABPG74_004103 [Tetrahymena malaccensis]
MEEQKNNSKDLVDQIYLSQQEDDIASLIEVPLIPDNIQRGIELIKKKHLNSILFCCILSKFGIVLCLNLQNENKETGINKEEYQIIMYFTLNILAQTFIGFMVDLISLKSAWLFTQTCSFLSIIVQIISTYTENDQGNLLANFLLNFSFNCNYICGTYILYDSSYQIRKRFNYQSFFVCIGSYIPYTISLLYNWFCIDLQFFKTYVFQGMIYFCLVINFIGGIYITKLYGQVENARQKSQNYQNALKYRGVGLTLKLIFRYYWNQNVIFLAVLLITMMSISQIQNAAFLYDSIQNYHSFETYKIDNSLKLLFYLSVIFIATPLIFIINKQKQIITSSFIVLRNLALILTCIQVIQTFLIIFQDKLSLTLIFIISCIILVFKAIGYLLIHVLCNQLLISLQSEKYSIKCIGLSFFGVFQDLTQIFYFIKLEPRIFSLLLSLAGILCTLYSFYYLKNRSFTILENKLLEITDTQPNISKSSSLIQS